MTEADSLAVNCTSRHWQLPAAAHEQLFAPAVSASAVAVGSKMLPVRPSIARLVRDAASQHHIHSTAPIASEHSESRGVSHRLGMFGRRRAVLQMWCWLVNANTSQWLSRPRTFRVGGFPFRGEAFPPAMPTSGSPGPAPESQERGGGLSVGLRPRSNHTTLLTEGRGNFAIAHAHPHSPTPSRSRSVPSHVHSPRCRRLAWHTILWHRRCLNQRLFTVHTRARIARCGRPACAGRHTL